MEEVDGDTAKLSALKENQATKGNNSYYYAHTREWSTEGAKVVSGPGIITGGQPVLLQTSPSPDASSEVKAAVKPFTAITKYVI